MDNFKYWLTDVETEIDSNILENMLELHAQWLNCILEGKEKSFLLPHGQRDFALKFKGKHSQDDSDIIQGPDTNHLIPYASLKQIIDNKAGKVSKPSSMFHRDQPYIGAFTQGSPENMASAIIFVLMTIRADFMTVMQDFPVVMMLLMSKFSNKPASPDEIDKATRDLEGQLMAKSNPATLGQEGKPYRLGYGLGTSLFGTKYKGVAFAWNNREEMYSELMSLVSNKDTVAVFEWILKNISGIAQAKAGFVVQLIFGELGCIDMHNVNLYSQYYLDRKGQRRSKDKTYKADHQSAEMSAPGKRDQDMYAALDPAIFSKKPKPPTTARQESAFKGAVKKYIDVLNKLEEDGFNTVKLWDIWVSYVSHNYVKSDGTSRYARTGMLAGNPLDLKDPADKNIMKTSDPIPDRNAVVTNKSKIGWSEDPETGELRPIKLTKGGSNDLPTYHTAGMEKERSAGAASAAHGAIWWWRMPEFWWDQVKQAQATENKPIDGLRFSAGRKIISKPLAYIASNPKLMQTVFQDPIQRNQFKSAVDDVMKKWDFWGTPHSDNKKMIQAKQDRQQKRLF